MDRTEQTRELMSALADGQLQGADFSLAMQKVAEDGEAIRAWRDYHAVGEALRAGERASGGASLEFLQKLRASLAAEPVPRREHAVAAVTPQIQTPVAANDGRWKIAAGFASVAALGALTWNMVSPSASTPGPQLATVPAHVVPVSTEAARPAMLRDPSLDRFLAAHRQLGGATALQQPTGFLRNATFEGAGR